ncbi:GNAT family N-acetyltransferase [Paenibacillus filicis]|uniref:GNAT family N-acetyltransferase n=1 Tax=Paenibacillus filicis TaxID=669464 RepID=A0ABU9DRQ5_9BACL
MNYRQASLNDIPLLMDLRKKQLVDEGIEPSLDIGIELEHFFRNKLSDGSLVQWLVEDHDEFIACGAMVCYEFPPTYTNKSGKKGYITNMYTKESYRGQGIATHLLTKLVDEAKHAGIAKLWLGASKLGRPVYKKFGFQETDEWMELHI